MLWIVVHDPHWLVIHSLRNITPYCFVVSSVCDASTPSERMSERMSENLRHQETQPRVQLHTEGLMIPSIQESFQETSESERQTVVSAQELAIALRSAGIHSLCLLENEVMRLTKEVAEQSTKKIAEGNSSHHSSVPVQPPGMACSQPFTPTEQVDSSIQTSRLAQAIPQEHVPSTSTAPSDTRSVADESSSKRQEAEKLEVELWSQASKSYS